MGTFPQLRYEHTAKRVRASLGGNVVVDTMQAWLVSEPQRVTPIFAVPEQELLAELAPPALPASAKSRNTPSPFGRARLRPLSTPAQSLAGTPAPARNSTS